MGISIFMSKSERLERDIRDLEQEAMRLRIQASRVTPLIEGSRNKAKEFANRNDMKRATEHAQDVVEKTKHKGNLEEQARGVERAARDIALKKSHLATFQSIRRVNKVLSGVAKMGVGNQDDLQQFVTNSHTIKNNADTLGESLNFDADMMKEETAAEVSKLLTELKGENAAAARQQRQAISDFGMPQFEAEHVSERVAQQ